MMPSFREGGKIKFKERQSFRRAVRVLSRMLEYVIISGEKNIEESCKYLEKEEF